MESEDLTKLWESFSLNDDNVLEVSLNSFLQRFGEILIEKTVGFKIIANWPINRDAFQNTMRSLWKIPEFSSIECLGVNIFAVTGVEKEEKK